ncbi:hypothetical protein RJ640_008884 [Escallonia rubra]|uniref:Cytochrome b5 heme-binding domain-containing protein n=1 Tax=Escallonia rubra TaxID=112253 RepID=A0AA88RIR4_9ASTE|nr:hypothetical protein RJ640_008884 [Escallonia rubra]
MGLVYDVTPFLDDHPGGDEVLLTATGKIVIFVHHLHCEAKNRRVESLILAGNFAEKDATDEFEDVGHSESAREMMSQYYIGDIDSSTIPTSQQYVPPPKPSKAASASSQAPGNSFKFVWLVVIALLILGLAFVLRFAKKE